MKNDRGGHQEDAQQGPHTIKTHAVPRREDESVFYFCITANVTLGAFLILLEAKEMRGRPLPAMAVKSEAGCE